VVAGEGAVPSSTLVWVRVDFQSDALNAHFGQTLAATFVTKNGKKPLINTHRTIIASVFAAFFFRLNLLNFVFGIDFFVDTLLFICDLNSPAMGFHIAKLVTVTPQGETEAHVLITSSF